MTPAEAIALQQMRPQLPRSWRIPPHPANDRPRPQPRLELVADPPEPVTVIGRVEALLRTCPEPLPYLPELADQLAAQVETVRSALRRLSETRVCAVSMRQRQRGPAEMQVVIAGVRLRTRGWSDVTQPKVRVVCETMDV
jgi:hypothetical protein